MWYICGTFTIFNKLVLKYYYLLKYLIYSDFLTFPNVLSLFWYPIQDTYNEFNCNVSLGSSWL